MQRTQLLCLLALGMSLATACSDDGVNVTTETSGSTGSTGSTSSATTNPTTTNPTTTDPTTGSTGPATTDASSTSGSTTDVTTSGSTTAVSTSGSTTDASTSSTTDASTSSSSGGDSSSSGGSSGDASSGSSTGMGDLCADGMLDQDETDIDCGGAICGDCADGQQCLVNEDCVSQTCAGGVCITGECAMDADCAGKADACNTATCDVNMQKCVVTPKMDGTMCDDANLCTNASACQAGVCAGSMPKDCSSLNSACGVGVCVPLTGQCIAEGIKDTNGIACDDKNACTANTTCLDGYCGDPNNKGYTFYEAFADNKAGWTIDTNWAIGAAKAGCGDPAADHTPTGDNGIAGAVLGGCVPTAPVDAMLFYCVTSPKMDTSALNTVFVNFWRSLWSDYTPYMQNKVEVFNGNTWQTVFISGGAPEINDGGWKNFSYDITAHKNANMQIRWCYNIGSGGAFQRGSWNVDDVTVGPTSCTP